MVQENGGNHRLGRSWGWRRRLRLEKRLVMILLSNRKLTKVFEPVSMTL